jgi:hypothetical protein
MNRLFACLALLGLAAAGCSDLPKLHTDQAVKAKAPVNEPPPAPPKPAAQTTRGVTADQVNDANARAMAQALREELDKDEQPAPVPTTVTPGSTTPKR